MDTIPYETIISSAPFTFVVGPDKREFFIHSALVASQSHSLDVLVNGRMQEATEQRVEWGETDETTFVLFSQFAYTGNYDGQERRTTKQGGEEQPAVEDDDERDLDITWRRSRKNKKVSRSFVVDTYVLADPYPGTPSTVHLNRFKEQCPDTLCDHYTVSWLDDTEVLLVHARMYAFADYHGIPMLQTLALRKLHRILVQFTLSHESVEVIVKLARYTYEHTRADRNDRLRSMVSMYGASNLSQLQKNNDFDSLLRTVGDFAGDLFQKICM